MKRAFAIRLLAVCLLACAGFGRAGADPVSDAFGGLKYRAIGPAISGGRTTAVAGSDADPRVYYAGGAGYDAGCNERQKVAHDPRIDTKRAAVQ